MSEAIFVTLARAADYLDEAVGEMANAVGRATILNTPGTEDLAYIARELGVLRAQVLGWTDAA